jgi:hypothetical protein
MTRSISDTVTVSSAPLLLCCSAPTSTKPIRLSASALLLSSAVGAPRLHPSPLVNRHLLSVPGFETINQELDQAQR